MSKTTFDLSTASLREVNSALLAASSGSFAVLNPRGAHALAAGITADIRVDITGSVGYYCAGMHQQGTVEVNGNASTGLAENMMSGHVRITGSATMSAGASGHGGLLVIERNAGARCGISMKGIDIVVGGNIGHMSAFMGQSGNLVVLGDAAADLGDSLYEPNIFVRGDVESLGADCIEKELRPEHVDTLTKLLAAADMTAATSDFHRYGSARQLYNFHPDDIDAELTAQKA
jgi:glutamate synthase domain-containing protein 3